MAIEAEHIEDWRGKEVRDPDGVSLGKLQEVMLDAGSGTPLLLSIKSGRLGRHAKLIPVGEARVGPDYVRVAHAKAAVDASPDSERDAPPGASELDEIGKAYGLRFSDQVRLESATDAEERRAAAREAQERADAAAAVAREKADALQDAQARSEGASAEADAIRREAEEAEEAARKARIDAERRAADA